MGKGFRNEASRPKHSRLGEGYAGRAALESRALQCLDTDSLSSPAECEFARVEGFTCGFFAPMIAKGKLHGVLEMYSRKPIVPSKEWGELLEALAAQAALTIDNAKLFNDLQQSNIELSMAYDATIEGWSLALDLRDHETEGHTRRVTEWTVRLARVAGLPETDVMHIRRGAILHDIGKMGIPDSILAKPGPLNEEERKKIQEHPQLAFDMLHPIEFLRPALDIPWCHHEKWDGSGYPRGLKGEEIPYAARLFAVADVWDALTNDRHYRKAWSEEQALEYLRNERGKHFDPHALDLFLEGLLLDQKGS
jgi:putative nucleotidyltransferase with HDIG domain